MVTDISKRLKNCDTEKKIVIPFLIEFKIWQSKNSFFKIPYSSKEYAKLSTMDLKSNTQLWNSYTEFCQKLFDIQILKKETKMAIESLGLNPNFLSCSMLPCVSNTIGLIESDALEEITSYNLKDRLGMLPYHYALMLSFMADLIGICPQILGKCVQREELSLDIFTE